jgi:hypothetical protein
VSPSVIESHQNLDSGGKSGEEDEKSGELTLPWNFPILEKIKLLELSG